MNFQNQKGLPEGGFRYKGNLHSHTVQSDGKLTPREAAELYRAHGYQFLCLSEHDRYTDLRAELNREDFLILPGLEASANLMDENHPGLRLKTHHMHGILGTSRMQQEAKKHFMPGETLPPPVCQGRWDGAAVAQQVCDTLRGRGCLVTYNHPLWSRVEPEEFRNVEGLWALEIYNYNTVNESANGADTTCWDLMLRSGRQIFAFASDDNHNEGRFEDSCGGWVVVFAPELTHDALLEALMRGDFYSSCGPELYGWEVFGDRVLVDCSACERISFVTGGDINAGASFLAPNREGLRHAEYILRGDETYVRVECVDFSGRTAWSNALFLRHRLT